MFFLQKLGYINDYNNKNFEGKMLRKLMCLSYIPEEFIVSKFNEIKCELLEKNLYADLLDYMEKTYIYGNIWKPKYWSVYNMTVRTNNNVEGWHSRLNTVVKANENFYNLVNALAKEADLIKINKKLLSENKLQRTKQAYLQSKIFDLWDDLKTKKSL